jgi:hypothetical protein
MMNQNIYITNDEEIKEGDWLFANQGVNKIVEIKEGDYPYGSINNKGDKIFHSKHWKSKIILTTDQDLIKDGVQAIDDEFLEWFVKNPSCQYGGYKDINWDKIITLKEETLEQAAERLYQYQSENPPYTIITPKAKIEGFIEGAKWQAERIPSIIEEYLETAFISKEQGYMNPKEWFEQFKK